VFQQSFNQLHHIVDGESGWLLDEVPVLLLPDISRHEMEQLLVLLTTGSLNNIGRAELARLVSLTHLLKLVSIPVALSSETTAAACTTNNNKRRRRRPTSPPATMAVDTTNYRAVISYLPALPKGAAAATTTTANQEQQRTASARIFGRASAKATPPNILLSGGGDVKIGGSDQAKMRPLLLPKSETAATAAAMVEPTGVVPILVNLSNSSSKSVRQQTISLQEQQQVVIVDPAAAAEIFLPHNSMLTLSGGDDSGGDHHHEFDMVVDNAEEDNPPPGGDEDAAGGDDDDDDVGNEADIEEIEIFLNGNGEVVRMEVLQNLHEEEEGNTAAAVMEAHSTAAGLSAADFGGMTGKVEFTAASIDEASRDDETVSRDQGFIADLGKGHRNHETHEIEKACR
jgi:hypothetical protein